MNKRHAGVNVPLFSLRSSRGWGIGELPDIAPLAEWMRSAGFDRLLLLPLGAMPPGQTSPYSAVSTMAIDPIYIALEAVSDFGRAGGLGALSLEARTALDAARRSPRVAHDQVRRAKDEALALAFAVFMRDEWEQLTPRASELAAYISRERRWLDDYALFQAISDSRGREFWTEWPEPLRHRDPRTIDEARRQLNREVLFHQYGQWIADCQWQTARNAAHAAGVLLIGDLPFVTCADSPEVWTHADEFRLDVSTGVPPDAFSPTGQDWGLPTYKWHTIAAGGYAWLRQRARRMAALFDGLRVDHVVGLFRTYGRPAVGEPFFTPADEPDQLRQGKSAMTILSDAGMILIAEDLGVVPDFVRAALRELGIPGCKVIRWERDWHAPGTPFLHPSVYPALSAAMTGTHDTEPLATWWPNASEEERSAFQALIDQDATTPSEGGVDEAWTNERRDAFIRLVYGAGSDELFLPIQDLFGWTDRVNVPGTVTPENWTWSLPWPVERLSIEPESVERAHFLRRVSAGASRGQAM